MYLINIFTIILLPFIGTLIGQQNSDEFQASGAVDILTNHLQQLQLESSTTESPKGD